MIFFIFAVEYSQQEILLNRVSLEYYIVELYCRVVLSWFAAIFISMVFILQNRF